MKTFTVAACTAFIVGLGCGTAQAHPPIVKATPAGQPPPVSWQQDALAAAESYWHHAAPWDPTCQVTVSYASLGDPTEGGETDNNCNIVINDREGWIYPDVLCLTLTHELGHVVLGPNAFPDNPSDPAHSSDPTNIMYPVIFDVTTPQCTAMLNKIYPPLHPRRAKRHHHRNRVRRARHEIN